MFQRYISIPFVSLGILLFLACHSGCGTFKGFGSLPSLMSFGRKEDSVFREQPSLYDGIGQEAKEIAKSSRETPKNPNEMANDAREMSEFAAGMRKNESQTETKQEIKPKNWMERGDSTFMMSGRAKEIHKNLER